MIEGLDWIIYGWKANKDFHIFINVQENNIISRLKSSVFGDTQLHFVARALSSGKNSNIMKLEY